MYDTILIPTDGGKTAMAGAEHGVEMAAALGASVHTVYVVEEGSNPWDRSSLEDQMDVAEDYGEEQTGKVADLAAEAGVDCTEEVVVGPKIPVQIYEYAEENDIDAIVMGSGYRGSLGGLLGSTAEKIVRMTDMPVTVVR